MVFYFFHLMPWPHLPDDFDTAHRSAWVTFSNKYYDPQRGHALYNRYLDELEHAEALGFDGICVNEHHQNAYGNMPSPNLIAACLARTTQRIKIAVVGNALPLYDHPIRVAEEMAMLDVISGGRMISGQVIGHGPETANLAELRPKVERFFGNGMTESERRALLEGQSVDFVFVGPEERELGPWRALPPELQLIYDEAGYAVYSVGEP